MKWIGTVVILVLAIAWTLNCWYRFGWMNNRLPCVGFIDGRVNILFLDSNPPQRSRPFFYSSSNPYTFNWQFSSMRRPEFWDIYVPIWALLLPAILVSSAAWTLDIRLRERERPGNCAKCGYNLSDLGEGKKCPECGGIARAV